MANGPDDPPGVTADDFDAATAAVVSVLSAAAGLDWRAAAGTGTNDAAATAEHLGDGLMSYAAQLHSRPADHYVRFMATVDKGAGPADLVEFVVAGAGMLSAALRVVAPGTRAYHPSGMADPAGFAGMGCIEMLVHGADLAAGLGRELDPPRGVCARVLARMFPDLDVAGLDPWTALLWATDRVELPGRPSREGWRWQGAPLD